MVSSVPRTKVVGKEGKATPCSKEGNEQPRNGGRTDGQTDCVAMYVHTVPTYWMDAGAVE